MHDPAAELVHVVQLVGHERHSPISAKEPEGHSSMHVPRESTNGDVQVEQSDWDEQEAQFWPQERHTWPEAKWPDGQADTQEEP